MQNRPRRPQFPSRPEASGANVTSAIGMEETAGRLARRRSSLFTQTLMWITGLICTALLLGSFAQAWSNSQLMQQLQSEQQNIQQVQNQHNQLGQAADHYKDPAVIEKEARQQLGYIRPGEHPVVIVGASDQGQQNTQAHSKDVEQRGYWQEWWRIFLGG